MYSIQTAIIQYLLRQSKFGALHFLKGHELYHKERLTLNVQEFRVEEVKLNCTCRNKEKPEFVHAKSEQARLAFIWLFTFSVIPPFPHPPTDFPLIS